MSMQFENVWERVADTVGDEIALINGDKKSSWSSFDAKAAKRAGLLHDIGKVSDEESELPHALLGMKLAERYGERPDILNAI